jgi:transcriptional repressor NrdR
VYQIVNVSLGSIGLFDRPRDAVSVECGYDCAMRCPVCRSPDTRVLDKRDSADASTTRRRRQCGKCLHRFTTYERPDTSSLMVVKSDRRRQEWNPDKLRRSLQVACTKRPISAETIERTVEQIEAELRGRDTSEVQSSVIGDLAMEKLRQLDQVAYIRFASVYRAFADISSFEDEVRRLIERAALNGSTAPNPRVSPASAPAEVAKAPTPDTPLAGAPQEATIASRDATTAGAPPGAAAR